MKRIENALDEARILVLGIQVLMGFQYQAIFQKQYDTLPHHAQLLKVWALWGMLIAMALLMAPAAYHRIVERGGTSHEFHQFITHVTAPALLPFALGIGIDFYVALIRTDGKGLALALAIAAFVVAVVFWYGLEFAVKYYKYSRGEVKPVNDRKEREEEGKPTPLPERIKMVLTEARVVLPGAQALLGFQFAATLTEAFDKLPPVLKQAHLVSLGLVALAAILLMAPAAYHRIVEGGEDTEGVHRFASRMVLAAMTVLAPGVCGDLFIVAAKVFGSLPQAGIFAVSTLAIFYAFWFGYMFLVRARRESRPKHAEIQQAKAA